MKDKIKKILVICPYPENTAPGQRLKYEQYFDFLRDNGYFIKISPFFSESTYNKLNKKGYVLQKLSNVILGYIKRIITIFKLPFYDGVYIFLYVAPFGKFLEKIYRLISKKIIYDIDDLVYSLQPNRPIKSFIENYIIVNFKSKSKYFYLMKFADHIITCTPYLNGIAKKYNNVTTDISSTINTQLYLPVNKYSNEKKLTIGWTGSVTTGPYLASIANILKEIISDYNCKLVVIGADKDLKLDGLEFEHIPWTAKSEVENLQKIDIGIYPLQTTSWALGKSGLKAIQYMALGIPVVATAFGANFRVIEHGKTGFLVNKVEEWKKFIIQLIENPGLRKTMGENGRERVEKLFSVNVNKKNYLKVFDSTFTS